MDDVVPITICYEDLVAFDDTSCSSNNAQLLIEQIGKAFGPCGLGIVLISGVPQLAEYRNALLPLAAQIPRLPPPILDQCIHAESQYAVGWSHGKEELVSGQPDTSKGSYYANPLTNDLLASIEARDNASADTDTDCRNNSNGHTTDEIALQKQRQRQQTAREHSEFFARNVWPPQESLPQLEPAFCNMGRLLHSVGCRVAHVCDAYCRQVQIGSGSDSDSVQTTTNLAPTLQQSLNATGRLLHYFAVEPTPNTGTNDVESTPLQQQQQPQQHDNMHTWCGWHKDHSALTGLVPGMYLDAQTMQPVVDYTNDDASPQKSGLYIQTRAGQLVRIVIPPDDHCAFQIGETSQILSGGVLQATPHAVLTSSSRCHRTRTSTAAVSAAEGETSPVAIATTRESFALFMEPEFDFVLDVPSGRTVEDCEGQISAHLGLRSIRDRYQPGMTYGEFHLATISAFAVKD